MSIIMPLTTIANIFLLINIIRIILNSQKDFLTENQTIHIYH